MLSLVLVAGSCDPFRSDELVSQRTADNIALCGAGLELERRTALSAAIDRATSSGNINRRDSRRLEAAFLAAFADTPEDADWLYAQYISCVTGEENLQALIEEIRSNGIATRSRLVRRGASDARVNALMQFRREEIAALERREYVEARRLKRAFVNGVLETVLSSSDASAISDILEAGAETAGRPLFNFPIPGAAPPPPNASLSSALSPEVPQARNSAVIEAVQICEVEYNASDCTRILAGFVN